MTRSSHVAFLAVVLAACGPDIPPSGPRDSGTEDARIDAGACADATVRCGSTCVDLQTSTLHCGACDAPCGAGEICSAGACDCAPGFTLCGDTCADTQRDARHCGACDAPCPGGDSCNAGTCGACGSGVSFARDVQPIFTASCATSPCHGGGLPARGVGLDAARAYGDLVGVTSSCRGIALVAPGDPDASYLVHKLEGTHECGGQQMPSGRGELSVADLHTIREWICGGARDD